MLAPLKTDKIQPITCLQISMMKQNLPVPYDFNLDKIEKILIPGHLINQHTDHYVAIVIKMVIFFKLFSIKKKTFILPVGREKMLCERFATGKCAEKLAFHACHLVFYKSKFFQNNFLKIIGRKCTNWRSNNTSVVLMTSPNGLSRRWSVPSRRAQIAQFLQSSI